MKLKSSLIILCLAFAAIFLQLTSCTQLDTFEKNTSIPKNEWKTSFEVKGSFSITDTTSSFITYIVLRHTDAYKYNNIWLNVGIQPPGDTLHYQKVDLQLGTDATGWMGTGMNDIWEIRQMLFNRGVKFKKAGVYNFTITQIMRDDPLPAIMSAGLRLEKQ
ncbi:gliding motility lipoprotein GldH [Ferruginibacter sp.]|nr:gliding motility lipoprotein GldH [Ferruginibacter sp.]